MRGGGIDMLSPNEPGLGGFQITLFDDAGGTGDATGQPTYDMFNMPLTNSLAGTIDPITGADACPISTQVTANATMSGTAATADQCSADPTLKGCQKGIVGMIVTCPKYESDGTTLSPFAGQAVVNNLYQGDTASWPRPARTGLHAAKSGCRPTRWTARRPTTRSCASASRPTSRNSDRRDITSRSASPIRRSSMIASRDCAPASPAVTK